MEPISEKEVRDLEDRAAYLKGEKARTLKEEVEVTLARADTTYADPELIGPSRFSSIISNCGIARCLHKHQMPTL